MDYNCTVRIRKVRDYLIVSQKTRTKFSIKEISFLSCVLHILFYIENAFKYLVRRRWLAFNYVYNSNCLFVHAQMKLHHFLHLIIICLTTPRSSSINNKKFSVYKKKYTPKKKRMNCIECQTEESKNNKVSMKKSSKKPRKCMQIKKLTQCWGGEFLLNEICREANKSIFLWG